MTTSTDTETTNTAVKRIKNAKETTEGPAAKKVRFEFDFKKFQKLLQTDQRVLAIKQLSQVLADNKTECVSEYVNQLGSLLDLVRVLEGAPAIQVLALELLNEILLQIGSNLPQYEKQAIEACEYLLKHLLPLINKMLGLRSSGNERYAMLKLLTTMVTFSSALAKDILVNVKFDQTSIKLLTKAPEGKRDIRDAFIHFVVAFLLDGQLQAITTLTENAKLMTGLFFGFKYDKCENVCLILSALKTSILENADITKTMKMKVFNTVLLRKLVDLYNWTGPGSVENRGHNTNEVEKAQVSESVHDFLIILCTTRDGVIFHDPSFGLSHNRSNPLVASVLQCLERPWTHSYAGELVKKICVACPDLIAIVWKLLQPYLEPRATEQWFKAVKYAQELLQVMNSSCLGSNIDKVTLEQMAQIIPNIVAPHSIINALTPKDHIYENFSVRYHAFLVIKTMGDQIANYVDFAAKHFDRSQLIQLISRYFLRNFPKIDQILKDWTKSDDFDRNIAPELYLNNALELLNHYKTFCPELLDAVDVDLDLNSFLSSVDSDSLKLQIVDFFLDTEPIQSNIQGDLFKQVILSGFQSYHDHENVVAFRVLRKLLEMSSMFYGCNAEIDIWINAVRNVKKYTPDIGEYFLNLVEKYQKNASKYDRKVSKFQGRFSPLFLVLNKYGQDANKSLKQYNAFIILNLFHIQFDLHVFTNYTELCRDLSEYINSWSRGEISTNIPGKLGKIVEKIKGFSHDFLEQKIVPENYTDLELLLVFITGVFYLGNLVKLGQVQVKHFDNFEVLVDFLVDTNKIPHEGYYESLFENRHLLEKLNIFDRNDVCTQFLVKIIKKCSVPDKFLEESRKQIVTDLKQIFQENQPVESEICTDLLEIFNLNCDDCIDLLENCAKSSKIRSFWKAAAFWLERIANGNEMKCLDNSQIEKLCSSFILLLDDKLANLHQLFGPFLHYLHIFTHNIEAVPVLFFEKLCQMPEYNKTNLALCEFLLDRKPAFVEVIRENLDDFCAKKNFVLHLLKVIVTCNNSQLEKDIYEKIQSHLLKILEKPQKAHSLFHSEYESIGYLIETYMVPDKKYQKSTLKFESSDFFHYFLLHKVFKRIESKSVNMLLSSIHLLNGAFKSNKPVENFALIFLDFLDDFKANDSALDSLKSNESFKVLSKFCLKYGVSETPILMKILSRFVELIPDQENCALLLEMMLSHSQFLDVILSNGDKSGVVEFWWILYEKFPEILRKEHVPLLLATYGATRSIADQRILQILKICETHLTSAFIEYKPFLWGSAAAYFYSIRSGARPSLERQPKIAKVLHNLDFNRVKKTIADPANADAYDSEFFLPLFSLILSQENVVPLRTFCRTGALALTITSLRSDSQSERFAACHVLSRFHFHMEAKQNGKDDLLWIRFIEALCKGVPKPDLKLNNFACVYLARTAVILTNPQDLMYQPLTQYLAAKDTLNFHTIPELYTFLHSPSVETKIHKHFILGVLRDGLRSGEDVKVFLKSMAFKLISQLCTGESLNVETKALSLDVLTACLRIPFGLTVLCGNLSFITQINSLLVHSLQRKNRILVGKLLGILDEIVARDLDPHRNFQIALNLSLLSDNELLTSDASLAIRDSYYKVLAAIAARFPHYLDEVILERLFDSNPDKVCRYFLAHGCRYARESDVATDLQLIFYHKLKCK